MHIAHSMVSNYTNICLQICIWIKLIEKFVWNLTLIYKALEPNKYYGDDRVERASALIYFATSINTVMVFGDVEWTSVFTTYYRIANK